MLEMLTARRLTPDWLLNETWLLFIGLWEDERWDEGWPMKDENRRHTLTLTIKKGRVQLRLKAQHNYTTVRPSPQGANTKSSQSVNDGLVGGRGRSQSHASSQLARCNLLAYFMQRLEHWAWRADWSIKKCSTEVLRVLYNINKTIECKDQTS